MSRRSSGGYNDGLGCHLTATHPEALKQTKKGNSEVDNSRIVEADNLSQDGTILIREATTSSIYCRPAKHASNIMKTMTTSNAPLTTSIDPTQQREYNTLIKPLATDTGALATSFCTDAPVIYSDGTTSKEDDAAFDAALMSEDFTASLFAPERPEVAENKDLADPHDHSNDEFLKTIGSNDTILPSVNDQSGRNDVANNSNGDGDGSTIINHGKDVGSTSSMTIHDKKMIESTPYKVNLDGNTLIEDEEDHVKGKDIDILQATPNGTTDESNDIVIKSYNKPRPEEADPEVDGGESKLHAINRELVALQLVDAMLGIPDFHNHLGAFFLGEPSMYALNFKGSRLEMTLKVVEVPETQSTDVAPASIASSAELDNVEASVIQKYKITDKNHKATALSSNADNSGLAKTNESNVQSGTFAPATKDVGRIHSSDAAITTPTKPEAGITYHGVFIPGCLSDDDNFHSDEWVAKQTNKCRYGAECNKHKCTFDHGDIGRPDLFKKPCRSGSKNFEADCTLDHSRADRSVLFNSNGAPTPKSTFSRGERRAYCKWVNTASGCRNGNKCPFSHEHEGMTCRYVEIGQNCPRGPSCVFEHLSPPAMSSRAARALNQADNHHPQTQEHRRSTGAKHVRDMHSLSKDSRSSQHVSKSRPFTIQQSEPHPAEEKWQPLRNAPTHFNPNSHISKIQSIPMQRLDFRPAEVIKQPPENVLTGTRNMNPPRTHQGRNKLNEHITRTLGRPQERPLPRRPAGQKRNWDDEENDEQHQKRIKQNSHGVTNNGNTNI